MHPDYGIKPQSLISIAAAISDYHGPIDWILSANDNPFIKPFDNITHQHNKARQTVIDSGYDALLSIEADMIVPPDAITKLVEMNTDIAYGLYVWRHKPRRWSAYKTIGLWGGESVSYDHGGQGVRDAWGKVIDVAGLGLGCTLIRSHVFERLEFRLHDGNPSWIEEKYADDFARLGIDPYRERRDMVCDDWLLALDAQHYGFRQQCDLSIVCGHITDDGTLWPDPNIDNFYRIEV